MISYCAPIKDPNCTSHKCYAKNHKIQKTINPLSLIQFVTALWKNRLDYKNII